MAEKKLSRRTFIRAAGLAVGGSALACAGLGFAATRQPNIELVETQCGGEVAVNDQILIAYATKCGSTGEVAEAIGRTLCERGARVDVKPAQEVTSLEGYSQVVIGSAIRMGNWVPAATNLVKTHQAQLARMPVAIFSVHMTNLDDDETSRQARAAYTASVRQLVTPRAEAFFAGKLSYAPMSFLDRMISKAMKAQEQDLRDWEAITAWATQLV